MLLGVGLAAIGVELVLQLVAFVLWAVGSGGTRPEGKVVLCLGDSLTYGLGAERDEAYPPRLEAELRRRGAAWSVVNAGIPGQSSADVLGRLPGLLDAYRPDVLCLLVGWNDTWSRPRPVTRDRLQGSGFPWRWRTGRLVDLALAQRRGAGAVDDEVPFVGTWHVRGEALQFERDGSARLGAIVATWRLADGNLEITPAGGAPFLVRWRESEGGIDFALFGWDRFYRARRGLPPPDASPAEFDEALELGAVDRARAIVDAARGAAGELTMRAKLCLALLRAGRRDDAAALCRELERAWQSARDPVAGEGVALWHATVGEAEIACAVATAVVERAPDRVAAWRVLVDQGPAAGRAALAARLEAAAAVAASPWRRAELTAERAVLLATADAEAGVRVLLQARELGLGHDASITAMMRAVAQGADRTQLLAAVPRVAPTPAVRDALDRDLRRATVTDAEMNTVLGDHVRLAIELCREHGTEPVLLGYPFPMPQHEAVMQRIAAAERVPFVSTVAAFSAKLGGSPRSDWYADEIHCSARGYALIATLAADHVAGRGR